MRRTVQVMKGLRWTLAFLLGVPLIGVGIPVAWLWVASQLQTDVWNVGFLALVVLVAGLVCSYLAVMLLAHWINPTPAQSRPRARWLEPMAPDRAKPRPLTGIETFFVWTTVLVAVGADIYLLVFGHPGVPHGP